MKLWGTIYIKDQFKFLFKYKSILLFPNGGINKFPEADGIKKVDEHKIIQNIKLQEGLYLKNLERYNNARSRDPIRLEILAAFAIKMDRNATHIDDFG